jgi:mRNA-degrading endonuclease RelE of RelBE toxin-antitoxin system
VDPYQLRWKTRAERDFADLERPLQEAISERCDKLCAEPRGHGVIKLKGLDAYRVVIREHRLVFTIDDTTQVVEITNVFARKDGYRRNT